MEPPPIQYVRTEDGFNIAYTVCGEGVPFVFMPWPWSHRGMWWQSAFGRPLSEALAARFRLVQYDSRGQGMSTRRLPEDFSIDDYLLDLEAVVGHLQLERFVLFGAPLFGHVAVKYAVQHPERVAALVLAGIRIDTAWGDGSYDELARRNWSAFIYSFAAGWSISGAPVETSYWRESINRDDYLLASKAARASNIADLLPLVQAPTFVGTTRYLRDGETPHPTFDDAAKIAAIIPNARLDIAETDGDVLLSKGDGPPPLVTRIEAFLRDAGVLDTPTDVLSASEGGPALSPRETEVLRLIAQGRSNQQIADELVLSVRTVERHITNLYAKIDAHGKADATAYALRNRIA
jgi:DNA-binding CsgD family transcriptional regulator/alpha-beta hydrolase superfamily lysophospholipase